MDKTSSKQPHRYQKLKIVSGIVVSTIIILICSASFIVKHKIKSQLNEINNLSYEKLNISWKCNNLGIDNIQLLSVEDSSKINCGNFRIASFSIWDFLKNNKININELLIQDGQVEAISQLFETKDSSRNQKENPSIFINKIRFENIQVGFKKKNEFDFSVNNLNGFVDEFQWLRTTTSPSVTFKNITLTTDHGSFKKAGAHYSMNWDTINIDHQKRSFAVNQFELKPQHTKEAWSSYFDYKKARLHLKIPLLQLDGFTPKSLLDQKIVYADSLTLDQLNLEVFTDESGESCPDCYKPLIHEQLYQIHFPIIISKALITNSNLDIEVLSKTTSESGQISFENIYASIYEINNTLKGTNHKIRADVQTAFMGEAELGVSFDFFMKPPDFNYTYQASIKNLPLNHLNTFSIPTKNARIESGYLQRLTLDVNGNNTEANGTMKFDYKDLKIKLVREKGGETKKILSGIINAIAIKNNNLPNNENYTTGKMHYKRLTNKSIFHQWSNTVQTGFKSILLPDLVLDKELK